MIRRLRSAHRGIWLAALIILPATIATGLGARRAVPLMAAPSMLPVEPLAPSTTWRTGAGVLSVTPVRIQGDSALAIEVRNSSSPGAPDLLLYWTRRDESTDSTAVLLPDSAGGVLLGAAGGTARRLFRLPVDAKGGTSALVLYSLGHRELLGRMPLADGRPNPP